MARDPKAWQVSNEMQPDFEGGLIQNQFLKGTLFIFRNIAQRNAHPEGYRQLDGDTSTMAFVTATKQLFMLINNPAGLTTDSDWEEITLSGEALTPVGEFDALTGQIVGGSTQLLDTDADGSNGEFYVVTNAPSGVTDTWTGLFRGQEVTINDGDWVLSVGDYFTVVVQGGNITWLTLPGIPQNIKDYELGSVQNHGHAIGDVTGLQTSLDAKLGTSDLADHTSDYDLIPDNDVLTQIYGETFFYKRYVGGDDKAQTVYSAAEIDSLLGGNPGYWKTTGTTTLTGAIVVDNYDSLQFTSSGVGDVLFTNDFELITSGQNIIMGEGIAGVVFTDSQEGNIIAGLGTANLASVREGNVILGYWAARGATIQNSNIIQGTQAAQNMTGAAVSFNVILGTIAAQNAGDVNRSVIIGPEAGKNMGDTVAIGNNTAVGRWALNDSQGADNSGFGAYAGYNATIQLTGTDNLFLGNNTGYTDGTISNTVVLATNWAGANASNKVYIGSATQNVILNAVNQDDTQTRVMVWNSTSGEIEWRDAATMTTSAAGNDTWIQYNNGGNLGASGSFAYNGSVNTLFIGENLTDHASGEDNFIWGNDNDFSGGTVGILFEKNFIVGRNMGLTSTGNFYHNYLFGYQHDIQGNAFNIVQNNFVAGRANIIDSTDSAVYQSFAAGYRVRLRGTGYVIGYASGTQEPVTVRDIAHNFSSNHDSGNTTQTAGHGVYGRWSIALGGINHDIPDGTNYAAIVGGEAIKVTAADHHTVYLPKVKIGQGFGAAIAENASEDKVAVIDSTTGLIGYRSAAGLGGGGGSYLDLSAASNVFTASSVISAEAALSGFIFITTRADQSDGSQSALGVGNSTGTANDSPGYFYMGYSAGTSGDSAYIVFDRNNEVGYGAGVTFYDGRTGASQVGIVYAADYSTNFTARSLVDKAYVDGLVGGAPTAGNGIYDNGGTWEIGGGALNPVTANVEIVVADADSYDIKIGKTFGLKQVSLAIQTDAATPANSNIVLFVDDTVTDSFLSIKGDRILASAPDFDVSIDDSADRTNNFLSIDTDGAALFTFSTNVSGSVAVQRGVEYLFSSAGQTGTAGFYGLYSNIANTGRTASGAENHIVLATNDTDVFTIDSSGLAEYGSDLSGSYTTRSLVDKAYVDANGGITPGADDVITKAGLWELSSTSGTGEAYLFFDKTGAFFGPDGIGFFSGDKTFATGNYTSINAFGENTAQVNTGNIAGTLSTSIYTSVASSTPIIQLIVTDSVNTNSMTFGLSGGSGGKASFTDSRLTTLGIEYGADYRAGFGNRSLVDKQYVDELALVYDSNQNEVISFTGVASALNYVGITNAATANWPVIEALGDNTDVGLDIKAKGAGTIWLTSNSIRFDMNGGIMGLAINSATDLTIRGSSNSGAAGDDVIIIGGDGGANAGGNAILKGSTTGSPRGSAVMMQANSSNFIVEVDDVGLGFFGVTPIVRQTTTSQTPATFTANTSGISDDTATWNGYTIGDLVAILQAYGLLT